MTILVFGKTGQVAHELGGYTEVTCLGRETADLGDPSACSAMIHRLAPQAVINAAAYTAVDRAEEEETLANIVNGLAPGAMAKACADLSIPLIHISTDYVFDGSGTRPWRPNDTARPLGSYGRSKLAGEQAVIAAGGVYGIVRTSWVFSASGTNFAKTMLRLGRERDQLAVVADQFGGPTPAHAIAEVCLAMSKHLIEDPSKTGLYHFSGAPDTNWAGFARNIFDQASISCDVADILSSDYPTPAARPLNSRLNCARLETVFGFSRPDWRQGLNDVLKDLGEI